MNTILVNEKEYNVLLTFQVLRSGWEIDNTGWIVQRDGSNYLVMTRYNRKYIASPEELDTYFHQLEKNIKDVNSALYLLNYDSATTQNT